MIGGTLDRLMAGQALGRWLVVLALGTGLVLLGDFVGSLGFYIGVILSERWWLFAAHYACRLPGFLALWMPLSVLVAALLTCAPMLRQGTLMALAAAGIAPTRVFLPFLALGVLAGGASFALGDLAVPRLEPLAEQLRARMKRGDTYLRSRVVGWRSGSTMWTVGSGLPEGGSFSQVTAFAERGGERRVVSADTLTWRGDAWQLRGIELSAGDRLARLEEAAPAALGLDLDLDRHRLAELLRPDSSRTSADLAASGSPRFLEVLCRRLATALLPLLCLAYGLPRFLRWADRQRLVMAGIAAVALAAIPLAGVAILGRLLVSAGGHPLLLAAGVVGGLLAGAWLRWRRMGI